MREQVIVWDLETIPDLEAFAAASNLQGKPESEVRDGMGDKFPKLVSHKIACIGALVVSRSTAGWQPAEMTLAVLMRPFAVTWRE